ncbi:MAG: hypothetical protein RJB26_1788 [Pseudomonadota bacterium]
MESSAPFVPVYTAAMVRAADLAAQRDHGVPGSGLMRAAAAAALEDLRSLWPQARRLLVVCGSGNNGGDGYDLATQALRAGLQPQVVALTPAEALTGDAQAACLGWCKAGGTCLPGAALSAALASAEVVVDALFGIGLSRAITGEWAVAVDAINASGRPVLALDLPSGLEADTGVVLGRAVRADFTSTFVGWKACLFLNPAQAGHVRLHSLEIPPAAFPRDAVPLLWQLPREVLGRLPKRARDSHKGRHGHVVVVGGDHGMPGAVRLAGEAALRSGAGRVTVLTRAEHAAAVVVGCPELMARATGEGDEMARQLAGANAIVCGPGLGRHGWGDTVLAAVLANARGRPLVLDADALVLLAAAPRRLSASVVLTPHPGEAATLLGTTVAAVQADRVGALRNLVERFGATVILKGAVTLTLSPGCQTPVACELGNPGMGTAGMGDVLAGVCGALAAQQVCDPAWEPSTVREMSWLRLAALAVVAHAAAGDLAAARGGQRGLLASDLFPCLREVLNGRGGMA